MTNRQFTFSLFSAAFLLMGQSMALAVECATCERNLANCRMPAQAKFVTCMNGAKTECSNKCATDCKGQKDSQRCTINCVRSCQGAGSCQATFASVTTLCGNTYQACKKDCTIPK